MALIFEGQTTCCLCDKILESSNTYKGIPPLTSNTLDKLYIFSDSGLHINCLDQSLLKDELNHYLDLYYQSLPLSNARCIVDGEVVGNWNDLISFGLLTSDSSEPLHRFNYAMLNKVNLSRWSGKTEFIFVAEKFMQDGKWKGYADFNYLLRLVNDVRNNS